MLIWYPQYILLMIWNAIDHLTIKCMLGTKCKDTATVAQLLVVWEISESKKLYANTFLVEHDGGFDWDKNALEALLYHRNFDRSRLCPDSATETWLLNDNTALMTTVEIINEDCVLNITISEVEKDNNTRIPAHINSEL
jgi:hypothetical protein